MANTVTKLGGVIDISVMTEDWELSDEFDVVEGIYVDKIKFFPGAASDKLIVRHRTTSGPVITVMNSIDGSGLIDPVQMENCVPFIKYSECTLSAGFHVVFTGRTGLTF